MKDLETLYRVVAVSQMGVSVQALLLLYQVLDARYNQTVLVTQILVTLAKTNLILR